MKKEKQRTLHLEAGLLAAFVVWTAAVCTMDVQPIGPMGTTVGFATLNGIIHKATGVHWELYTVTDWLGLVPLGIMAGFAVLGLIQWIRRKHICMVDRSILVLGGFYAALMAVYGLLEVVVINYRPVLVNGIPEASYPSSTTMLVLCVMPTAIMQWRMRIKDAFVKRWVEMVAKVFLVIMVVGRFLSGVHWFTDIVGGMLLSGGLVGMYRYFINWEIQE